MIYLCEEEKHRHGVWIVEGVTKDSEWCTTLFIGKDAEARALAYAKWMNHCEEMTLCVGYDGGCDGDLIGYDHIDSCPAKAHLQALADAREKE